MNIVVVLEPSEEGGYTASVPSLPGCISEGETVEEALGNIREAFELYVEPTEDDLIVGERDIVETLELDWRPTRPPRLAEPHGDGGTAAADRPEYQPSSSSRPGRAVEMD